MRSRGSAGGLDAGATATGTEAEGTRGSVTALGNSGNSENWRVEREPGLRASLGATVGRQRPDVSSGLRFSLRVTYQTSLSVLSAAAGAALGLYCQLSVGHLELPLGLVSTGRIEELELDQRPRVLFYLVHPTAYPRG